MPDHFLGIDSWEAGGLGVVVDRDGVVVRRATFGMDAAMDDSFAAGVDGVGWSYDTLQTGAANALEIAVKAPKTQCSPGDASVVAEAWIGAARGARHVICLTVGQRVLAGILLDGVPWRGANGRAGAAAWLALNPVERQDYRKFGSLAAEVSDKGIARRLAWRVQAGDESAVADEAGDLEAITAAKVFDGARAGDGVAISVVRDTAKYIGMALANFAVTIDPEVLVVGGDVARAGDLLLEPVRQEFARRVPPAMAAGTHIEFSPLANEGIAIGAARLAMLARA